jgi:2,3-bisphosphoglycerate-dependent phosphoglycerate mutase
MERLILARHGESEYSVRGTLNGDPSTAVGLTGRGRRQARKLGKQLAGEPIDLCVTSRFARTAETADLALAGREVPRLVVPELDDHPAGDYEGRSIEEYLQWAHGARADELIPGTDETRAAVVQRFARGFRLLIELPERTILAVLHSLPIVYLVAAAEGVDPAARADMLPYAEPRRLSLAETETAVERLERWCASPTW